jgi:hypothetical protein
VERIEKEYWRKREEQGSKRINKGRKSVRDEDTKQM